MNPTPIKRVPPPKTATQIGPILERLMTEYGVNQAFTISPAKSIRLPHYCDNCGRAEWDRAMVSFRCPEHPRGATLGTSTPCVYWSAPTDCIVFNEDNGDVYYLR